MRTPCKAAVTLVLAALFPMAAMTIQQRQQNQSKPGTKIQVPAVVSEKAQTLGSMKRKYLNQRVVIRISGLLYEWYPAMAVGSAVSGCKLAPSECRRAFAAELGYMIFGMPAQASTSELGDFDLKAIFATLQQQFPNGGRWGVFAEGDQNNIFVIASPDSFRSVDNQVAARNALSSNANFVAALCSLGFKFVRAVPVADIVNNGTEYGLKCPNLSQNSENAERYGPGPEPLAASYTGKSGVVVNIQLHEAVARKVNALGEVIAADDITVADLDQVDFVVKLEDGQLAVASIYKDSTSDFLQLASEHDAIAHEMSANLPSIVGKRLYAVGYSELYPADTTLNDLEGPDRLLKQIPITDVPLLEPLEVMAANYIESSNEVVLKLKLPSGTEALAITDSQLLDTTASENLSFLQKVSGYLLPALPKTLTPREILAIKKRSVFRGMSKDAVDFALGPPEATNDWGKGGKQLIYFSNTLLIYLDNQNKVDDVQSLHN